MVWYVAARCTFTINSFLQDHGFSQHWYAHMQFVAISETAFASTHTVVLNSLAGKIITKTNLTLSLECDGCAGEPGDKASWLVEDWGWAIKAVPYLELILHNQHFQVHYNTIPTTLPLQHYCIVHSVPPQKESAYLNFFWT